VQRAKALVDGSAMPMSAVAFAAGFASIRRFNAAFRAVYRRPPTALRRARTRARGEGWGRSGGGAPPLPEEGSSPWGGVGEERGRRSPPPGGRFEPVGGRGGGARAALPPSRMR
jgi:hypothetical protein